MSKMKKFFNTLLMSCAFLGIVVGGFLTFDKQDVIFSSAEVGSYDAITNDFSNEPYFKIDTNFKIGTNSHETGHTADNSILLFDSSSILNLKIGDNIITVANDSYYAYSSSADSDGNISTDATDYYYFNFQNSLSLYYNLTNEQIENGQTSTNLLSGHAISNFAKESTSTDLPINLSFTPQRLNINIKLSTDSAFPVDEDTITLNNEGCYTLSIPVVSYHTTNNGATYDAEEKVINYTFMAFKTGTYFDTTDKLPLLTSSSNIQDTIISTNAEFSKYYYYNYSAKLEDDKFTLPTIQFNPNLYQFKISYTDVNQNPHVCTIEYLNGIFTQYDSDGNIIAEQDQFVYTTTKDLDGNNLAKNTAKLVFNDIGTYDLEIQYLYKSTLNNVETIYTLPLENLTDLNFRNKKQRLLIYGFQTVFSDYSSINPLTNQPYDSELKTLDTEKATYNQSADITMGVTSKHFKTATYDTANASSFDMNDLKTSTLAYINGEVIIDGKGTTYSPITPISTNQTPVKFISNVSTQGGYSGLYKMTQNDTTKLWEIDPASNLPFSTLNQNTPGTYLYIIQYKYDNYRSSSGTLLPESFHYQIFFFKVTNETPTVTLVEVSEVDNDIYTGSELYTRGYTNKDVLILDNSQANPYDAKVNIGLVAWDYVGKRNYLTGSIDSLSTYGFEYKNYTYKIGNGQAVTQKGIFISAKTTNTYRNAKWTINITATNATKPSVTTFTIDTYKIEDVKARAVSYISGTNYRIGQDISSTSTNQPIVMSWEEKDSGATTSAYLKYIPMNELDYYTTNQESNNSTLLQRLLELDTLPVGAHFNLSSDTINMSSWIEYANTYQYSELVTSSSVRQNNGLYILEIIDQAGNFTFEIFLIDKTSPVFVKTETDENLITSRSIITSGEIIDVPENELSTIKIQWSKYKGIKLTNFETFAELNAYQYSKTSTSAGDELTKKLNEYFEVDNEKIQYLSGIGDDKQGYYLKIEVDKTYFTWDNELSLYASSNVDNQSEEDKYSYNVELYELNANGELRAKEASHSILLRDSSNTINYGNINSNFINAPSGLLSFRVSADASRLDIKTGAEPTETEKNWNGLTWADFAFDKSTDRYKYSYIVSTNATQKLTLTYIPYPTNGAVVSSIQLKFYPYVKEVKNDKNNYFYYTLADNPTRTIDIFTSGNSAESGEEKSFEIILGDTEYPVAGKYVITREYEKASSIGKYDYLQRVLTFIVDPYNTISEVETVTAGSGVTSLESVVGGDVLISMSSGSDQSSIEVSFPRYDENGINQGSFYTKSTWADTDRVQDDLISVSGNKLPLSLLIPQYKYTVSSKHSADNNSYKAENNSALSNYGNAQIVDQINNDNGIAYYEVVVDGIVVDGIVVDGIVLQSFLDKQEADAYLATTNITEYKLAVRVEFKEPNATSTSATYYGGFINDIVNNSNLKMTSDTNTNYLNLYQQRGGSANTGLTFNEDPITDFRSPGTYEVTLYQANNRGSTFSQLYSLYKFAFKIEETAPSFDIIDEDGYKLEAAVGGEYYTNSDQLTIQWQIPESIYMAKIDEGKITITNDEAVVNIKDIVGNQNPGDTRSITLVIPDDVMDGGSYKITMQFEGHNTDYYDTTTKIINFDVKAPKGTLSNLIRNASNSSGFGNSSALLSEDTIKSRGRANIDYKGEVTTSDDASYLYANNSGVLRHYSFIVSNDFFTNTLINALKNTTETNYVYYRSISDINTYTQVEKSSFNSSSYTELKEGSTFNIAEAYYEIVERDYAGNMAVYVVYLTENENTFTISYNNESSRNNISKTFNISGNSIESNIYSNTGFEIRDIYYKAKASTENSAEASYEDGDQWLIMQISKAGARINENYMFSPNALLNDGEIYRITTQSGVQTFTPVTIASIFNGVASSNRKHIIRLSNRYSGDYSILYLTIYNANLTAQTSYTANETTGSYYTSKLSINIPNQTQVSDTQSGYVYPVEIEVSLLSIKGYDLLGTITTGDALNEIVINTDLEDRLEADSLNTSPWGVYVNELSMSDKLKYEITDNFGNKTTIIQLVGQATFSEIVSPSGVYYTQTESDNSTTYISAGAINFTYNNAVYGISPDKTLPQPDLNGNLHTYHFELSNGETEALYTIGFYDSDDIYETILRTIHIRLYNKLPAFNDNTATTSGPYSTLLDRNLKAITTTTQTTIDQFALNGRTYENIRARNLTTYSPIVTLRYTNSEKDNGETDYCKKVYPYSAWLLSDRDENGIDNFDEGIKITDQEGSLTEYSIRGVGKYIILIKYDDQEVLTNSYVAYIIEILDSASSYYTVTVDGEKIERSNLSYTNANGMTYEVNYLVSINYANEGGRVAVIRNEELNVTISAPVLEPITGTNVQVAIYNYSCEESKGSFAVIFIPPLNSFASFFNYETPAGGQESLLSSTSKLIDIGVDEVNFDKLKLTFTSYYGIEANKVNLRVEKLFNSSYIDVSPEVIYSANGSTAYITRSGTYRISLYDSCTPANVQTFRGNPYTYINFLNSVPFVVTTTDENGATIMSEPIQNAVYNSSVTLSLTSLTTYYSSSGHPVISVRRNGVTYRSASGSSSNGYTERNYQYTFAEPGFYEIEFTATSIGTESKVLRKPTYYFTIINKNESRYAYSFTKYSSYYIKSIERIVEEDVNNGISFQDITNDILALTNFDRITIQSYEYNSTSKIDELVEKTYLTELAINYLDEKTGGGKYRITICPNEPAYESLNVKEFSFECRINRATPPIEVSISEGEETTSPITVSFNVQRLFNEVGDCYIKIGSAITNINENTIGSLGENHTLTITETGTYFIQVYTASGQLLYSYKVIKNEPLNTFAILAIIIGVLAFGVIVTITVVLRKRQKIK